MVFAQHSRSDRDGGVTPVHVAAAVGSFPDGRAEWLP